MTTSTVESTNGKSYRARNCVYQGLRFDGDGNIWCTYGVLEDDGSIVSVSAFAYTKQRHRTVGGVYNGAEFDDGGNVRKLESATWVARWDNSESLIEWEANNHDVEYRMRAAKMEKDSGRADAIRQQMLPLRAAYDSLRKKHDIAGMRALKAAIIAALEMPPRVNEK